jgi:putative molybdopterin biosynthesis protein
MDRDIYLETRPLDEALSIWLAKAGVAPLEAETVKVADSLGRVTAAPVSAKISSPFYHSSAMDGYAVRFTDTFGASETSPKRLKVGDEAVYIDTGDPVPDGFNAVIMIEDVNEVEDFIEIISAVTPWKNVRTVGEDIVQTELIVPENHRIRAVDIGAMLAGGHTEISVRRSPRVAVIPTGSEIVEPGTPLKRGDIIEFNSQVLGGLAREWGAEFMRMPIVPDDISKIRGALLDAHSKADLIVINAGASAGSEDYTAKVIAELGEVLVHGVGIKPGKPTILGIVNGKPVIGAPGFPVSAYLSFVLFARPLIMKLQGLEAAETPKIKAKLSRHVASSLGQEEFLRMKLGRVGENLIATPLGRGAGLMLSLVRADGIMRVPAMSEGIAAGTEVSIDLLREPGEIENTIVFIGSHDNSLDLLANFLKKRHPRYSLSSAHVGSMGGLVALKKGEAHAAPTHLLDEDTGEYNVSYIKKLIPDKEVALINLVYREQGLMVLKGNPKNIRAFKDLTRDDVTYINRQGGAGTRLLLDKCLKDEGIDPADIKGYEREEYTHMAVASAVLTGVADAGLGVLSAANALGLDFVPVAKERYDLAIPEEFIDSEMMQALLKIIREDGEFKSAVMALGGYDVSNMGKVMYEG